MVLLSWQSAQPIGLTTSSPYLAHLPVKNSISPSRLINLGTSGDLQVQQAVGRGPVLLSTGAPVRRVLILSSEHVVMPSRFIVILGERIAGPHDNESGILLQHIG